MSNLFLFLTRFAITAWCGAAVIFVVITVLDIITGQFTSVILDQLILIRFPVYYCFTFVLLSTSLVSGIASSLLLGGRKFKLFTVLVLVSLIIMVSDYFWIYLPLEEMLLPLGSPRPQQFSFYHRLTEALNIIALLIGLLASIVINWPMKQLPEKS